MCFGRLHVNAKVLSGIHFLIQKRFTLSRKESLALIARTNVHLNFEIKKGKVQITSCSDSTQQCAFKF
jgi:hypothetical protein